MTSSRYADILQRIEAGLNAARAVFQRFTPGAIETEYKIGHDPVTEADRAAELIILAALARSAPGVPVIAEEEVAAGLEDTVD